MADPRKQLQWERDALAAGMDPAEVEKRRELQDRLYQAEETAIEVIDRQRRATTLLLEGMAPEDMNERVELDRYPPEAPRRVRDDVRRCLAHLGLRAARTEAASSTAAAGGGKRK